MLSTIAISLSLTAALFCVAGAVLSIRVGNTKWAVINTILVFVNLLLAYNVASM